MFSRIQQVRDQGELAEWSKAPAWKAGIWATVSGVQIPHSPPPHVSISTVITQNTRQLNQILRVGRFLSIRSVSRHIIRNHWTCRIFVVHGGCTTKLEIEM